jgi:ribosomal protein S18 acetylase RimI-like enzyme
MSGPDEEAVLDNPVWYALNGPQSPLAERAGRAVRFAPEVSPFGAVDDDPDEAAWADLLRLDVEGRVVLVRPPMSPPAGWRVRFDLPALQMLAPEAEGEPEPEATLLGAADVTEVLALIERTDPGPFLSRTIELGPFLGIRRDGRLVAMAGERLRIAGWSEVSAVCTDESVRGQGLARRLVLAVMANIRARGDRPLLHVRPENERAIGLYRSLGFEDRRQISVTMMAPPD